MAEIALKDVFTDAEIAAARKLYAECKPGQFNKRVVKQIVEPAMARINRVTGQENNASYFGYLLEYALTK